MELFKSPEQSHEHSMEVLSLIYDHDDFMESLTSIADVGCGHGQDIFWWSMVQNREESPTPYNYRCLAIDKNIKQYAMPIPDNLKLIQDDFSTCKLSKPVDLVWCHDSLQYVENPFSAIKNFNSMLSEGGVLVLMVPQTVNIEHNRWVSQTHSHQLFSFTITNLIYMLACAGFDCKESHFYKKPNDPWLYAMVYKSDNAVIASPSEVSWYDLLETDLLPKSAEKAIKKKGYLSQHDLVTRWLDKSVVDWSRV